MSIQICKFVLFSAVMVFGIPFAVPGYGEPLTGEEKEVLLKELNIIQGILDDNRLSLRSSAVQTFTTAAASDKSVYEFYLQCHKKLKFDTRDASFTEFRNWRDENEGRVKTKTNLAAMRLQLQFLVLSLRAAEGVKPEVIMPELESFVANIVNHVEDLGTDGLRTLRGSVKRTIFAEAYNLDKSLVMENWSYTPGDHGSVYQNAIFPYVRSVKPEALGAAWDRRISLDKKWMQATQADNQPAMTKFETEKLPSLHWQKAMDIFKSYSPQQGAQSMLQIVKAYPDHPSLNTWVKEFRMLLTEDTETETTSPSEEVVPLDKNNPLGFENFKG